MKKISIALFLVITSLTLVACGSNSDTTKDASSENEKTEVNATQTTEVSKDEPVKEEVKTLTINKGETLILDDFAEITVNANNFGKVINPPSPADFYTYYESKEVGETFLDTVITVKSLLTSQKTSNEFVSVKILYDNKYEYETFSTIEDQGGTDFTYTNITAIEPLKVGTLHYLAEVPETLETDGKPLKALITINGETYEQTIR